MSWGCFSRDMSLCLAWKIWFENLLSIDKNLGFWECLSSWVFHDLCCEESHEK